VPGTRLERLLFLIGVVAAAVLAVLVFAAWRDYRHSAPSHAVQTTPPPAPQPAASVAGAAFKSRDRAQPAASHLVLTAARGESWVEVRAGSETAPSLYAQTLTRGKHLSYRRARLWIRFGLPVNIDATIDGKSVELPAGVADVLLHDGRLTTVQNG